jgi:hypothetical protein
MPLKNTTVSVESCADACKGYKYFGVEYGGEVRALTAGVCGCGAEALPVLLRQQAGRFEQEGERDGVQHALSRRAERALRRVEPPERLRMRGPLTQNLRPGWNRVGSCNAQLMHPLFLEEKCVYAAAKGIALQNDSV